MVNIEKLKWRSRRSMLELDLIFDKFIQSDGLSQLSATEKAAYADLLELDDDQIQVLFGRKAEAQDFVMQTVINKIISVI